MEPVSGSPKIAANRGQKKTEEKSSSLKKFFTSFIPDFLRSSNGTNMNNSKRAGMISDVTDYIQLKQEKHVTFAEGIKDNNKKPLKVGTIYNGGIINNRKQIVQEGQFIELAGLKGIVGFGGRIVSRDNRTLLGIVDQTGNFVKPSEKFRDKEGVVIGHLDKSGQLVSADSRVLGMIGKNGELIELGSKVRDQRGHVLGTLALNGRIVKDETFAGTFCFDGSIVAVGELVTVGIRPLKDLVLKANGKLTLVEEEAPESGFAYLARQ